jgi:hypothetical protein
MIMLSFDGAPADHEVAEDGSARGRATDNAAALEQCHDFAFGLRAAVVLHDVELPPALEPDATGLADDGDEGVRVSELAVLGKKDGNVPRSVISPRLPDVRRDGVAAAGVRHVQDEGVRSARRLDERLVDLRSHRAATDHDDGSLRRSDSYRSVGKGSCLERRPETLWRRRGLGVGLSRAGGWEEGDGSEDGETHDRDVVGVCSKQPPGRKAVKARGVTSLNRCANRPAGPESEPPSHPPENV